MLIIFAYLDAGTGAMVLQALVGAGLATMLFVRGFGHRVKKSFGSVFGRKKTEHDKNDSVSSKSDKQ